MIFREIRLRRLKKQNKRRDEMDREFGIEEVDGEKIKAKSIIPEGMKQEQVDIILKTVRDMNRR